MLLVLAASAWAAVPFELPPGEKPAEWSAALALAGFEPGDTGDGVGVELVADGETWRVVVHDSRGGVRSVGVARPVSARERQDIAWMAQSLLEPAVLPVLPAASPRPPPPRATPAPPRAAPPPPTPAEPVLAVLPSPPPPPPPVEVAPVAVPPGVEAVPPVPDAVPVPERPTASPRARVALRAGAGGGLRLRDGASAAPLVEADVGLRAGTWTLTGTVGGLGASALRDLAPEVGGQVWGATTLVSAGWQAPWLVSPELTLGAGAVYYRFVQDAGVVGERWVPTAVATAGLGIGLAPRLRVSLAGRATMDTDVLHLTVNGRESGGWSAWSIEPVARLLYEPPPAPRRR